MADRFPSLEDFDEGTNLQTASHPNKPPALTFVQAKPKSKAGTPQPPQKNPATSSPASAQP